MLKGLILAAAVSESWKGALTQEGLSWIELNNKDTKDFLQALDRLQAERQEVLCLVETDREEQIALKLGLFCVGYLNPEYTKERLSGCRVLLEGLEEADKRFFCQVHRRALGLPLQIAETKRLLIREMTTEDLDAVRALYQEEERPGFFPEFSPDRAREEERITAYIHSMYELYQFGIWVVIEKESKKIVGRVGFGIADYMGVSEIDLGYFIETSCRRRGYAKEACLAVLDYAQKYLDFPGLSAYVDTDNLPSLGLLEKLGFVREQEFLYQGRRLYRYLYGKD